MSGDNNIPNWIKTFMTVTERLGFPIIVCAWLAYQQFIDGKESRRAISEFKEVLVGLKSSIDQQNKIMRRTR